jgi:methionyl-tRNA formyltransferase
LKILFLSPHKHLISFLESFGDEVTQTIDGITELPDTDFIISYGYRRKIDREITEAFKNRAINLHISYLPWNRGADPNLWSFLEDTPKGVTIHYLDGNIDTGDILAQELLEYDLDADTLRTAYRRLTEQIEALFRREWPKIRLGEAKSLPQLTFHRVRDKQKYEYLLKKGWDTKIKDIIGKAK